jgi:hypothetical protein
MRLKAGKTEYLLPVDFHKLDCVYIAPFGYRYYVQELPIVIPATMDTTGIQRREKQYRERHPKESIPVMVTVYPPARGKRRSKLVFFPAPSKAFTVEVNYLKRMTL